MRLRIAYENDIIKAYVEQKIKGSSTDKETMHPKTVNEKTTVNSEAVKVAAKEIDKLRIAIFPFANISPDPTDAYFADGLTEELISTLSKISQLRLRQKI